MDADRARLYPFVSKGEPPLVQISRTEGCYLYTADGRAILDAAGGAIVCNIGHGRREIAEIAARALAEVDYVVPPFATPSRVDLVARLRERWLPNELTRVFFTNGGSDAVDAAIRIARQHHVCAGRSGRWKVIGRELSYHGTTLATLAVGGHEKRRRGLEPLLAPHPKLPACYPLRCAECRGACSLHCADTLEGVIAREGADTIAAVIAEPIGGSTAGALVPPDGYWPRLAEICRRHGILLIADEVMTGFGRTGRRFAIEHFGVVPDLLIGGKGLAGGYAPIGAVFAREAVVAPIADAHEEVMFYTTSAHPAACAVADTVLDVMEREGLVERAAKMGELLAAKLARLRAHPNVGDVRGRGLLQAVELVRDKASLEPFPAEKKIVGRVIVAGLVRHDVFFYPGGGGPAPDVICLGPPFTVREDELDRMVDALEASIAEAAR
ncbi:MAG TPA: aspartate aminotransferase family protein [Myxococcota bacterium]|jgi:adenosylmethionine-8-amino-7-oxononanoate aminotransferase|nr:aspartate aminotransferase family protein [Myxococcota bacterium]